VDETEKVVLTNVEYLEKLAKLIQKSSKRAVANYLGWQVTKSVMTYLNDDALKIKQNYDKALSGIQV
jgi:predicted metalloendopeptidase